MNIRGSKVHSWYIMVIIVTTIGMLASCSQTERSGTSSSSVKQSPPWDIVWTPSTQANLSKDMFMKDLKAIDPEEQQHIPFQTILLFNGSLDGLAFVQLDSSDFNVGLVHIHRSSIADPWNNDGKMLDTRPGYNGSNTGVVTDQLQGDPSIPVSFHAPKASYSGTIFKQMYDSPYVMEIWDSPDTTLIAAKLSTLGTLNTSGLIPIAIQGKSAWSGISEGFSFTVVSLQGNYYVFAGTFPMSLIQSVASSTIAQIMIQT